MVRAWLLALCGGISAACVVELDHRVACGDGFHDREVEECDPEDEESWGNACSGVADPNAQPGCHPVTCTLECTFCGDGILDQTPLANGDPREECDPMDADQLAAPRLCAGAGEQPPLRSPRRDRKPYTSGTTVGCLADCTYDRSNCGYCGDGIADGEVENAISQLQIVKTTLPEQCDGDDFDPAAMLEEHPECVSPDGHGIANVGCNESCEFGTQGMPKCCLTKGGRCPEPGTAAPCCIEIEDPLAPAFCELSSFWNEGEGDAEDDGWKCR